MTQNHIKPIEKSQFKIGPACQLQYRFRNTTTGSLVNPPGPAVMKQRCQRGQGLIEYLIIVGIVAIGSIGVVSVLGGNLNRKLAVINAGLIGVKYSEKNGEQIKDKALNNRDLGNFLNGASNKKTKKDD